jgi:hypothetical protein
MTTPRGPIGPAHWSDEGYRRGRVSHYPPGPSTVSTPLPRDQFPVADRYR